MTRRLHELKTWTEPYEAVVQGLKNYEIRVNDRDFQVGDWLILREWDRHNEKYTGRSVEVQVLYMTKGGDWGIPDHLCVMSLGKPQRDS